MPPDCNRSRRNRDAPIVVSRAAGPPRSLRRCQPENHRPMQCSNHLIRFRLTPDRLAPRSSGQLSFLFLMAGYNSGRKKSAPVFGGGQVALVLSCCESLVGGLTAGWPLARDIASEGGATATAVPHHSKKQSPGVTLLLGPPNCFPSTQHAPCCGERVRSLGRPGHCQVPRRACGRRESDVA